MAYAFQLNDRGLVQDPIALAKIADLPNQGDLLEAMDSDTARAVRENAHMFAGSPRTVESFDDHVNHLNRHRDAMRSELYENADPQTKQIIRWHMAAHEQYAAFQAAQMAQAASVSPVAAAMPNEMVNPITPEALAEAANFGKFTPSAASAGGMGEPPPELEAPAEVGPPPVPGGPGPGGGPPPPSPDGQSTQQKAQGKSQDQLSEGPP